MRMNFASSFLAGRKSEWLRMEARFFAAFRHAESRFKHDSNRSQIMLPYWIELSPADLIQGTAVLTLILVFLVSNLFAPAGR